jgi:prepilin-type processing-associated H-X9-DG protein
LAGTGPATLGDAFAGTGRVESKDMFDINRHNHRINIAFADGHVETVPLTQPEMDRIYIVPP